MTDRALYCGRAVDFVLTTFGMRSTLEAMIESLKRQIASPEPGHPTNEKYLKVLLANLETTLKNYEDRYNDESDE